MYSLAISPSWIFTISFEFEKRPPSALNPTFTVSLSQDSQLFQQYIEKKKQIFLNIEFMGITLIFALSSDASDENLRSDASLNRQNYRALSYLLLPHISDALAHSIVFLFFFQIKKAYQGTANCQKVQPFTSPILTLQIFLCTIVNSFFSWQRMSKVYE